MTYKIPAVPHATLYSLITQTVAANSVAYPVIFEKESDIQSIYRKSATVLISQASPAVVSWTGHNLTAGAVIFFTTTVGLPAPLAIDTPYYIISAGLGTDSFQISTSLGGAAVNTSTSGSGSHTARCVSRFYVDETGDYLINISVICDSTSGNGTIDIWFDVNGSNLADSNTIIAMDGTNQSTVAIPIALDLNRGDYVRLFYRGSTANMRIPATAAAASPTRPACPSIIMTIQKIGM